MNNPVKHSIRTGSGADLAFAVVVLTAYFITFSSLKDARDIQILSLIGCGIAYITNGIYGYAYCARSNQYWKSIIYFFIQLLLGGSIIFLGKGAGLNILIFLPLCGHSVILFMGMWVYLINALILGTYCLSVYLFSISWQTALSNMPSFLAGQVFVVAFVQMAVSEERARIEVEKLVRELASANQKLRDYAARVEELTLTQERNRLAREIHDGLGHYLTSINMQIQAAVAIIDSDKNRALQILANAQSLTKEALIDVRRSISALRESGTSLSLKNTIEKIIENIKTTGVTTVFNVMGEPRILNHANELAITRTVQEGLSNTYKHASATCVWVNLDYTETSYVKLEVIDNGVGVSHPDSGFGLQGLKERIELLNGQMSIDAIPDKGFSIKIKLPE